MNYCHFSHIMCILVWHATDPLNHKRVLNCLGTFPSEERGSADAVLLAKDSNRDVPFITVVTDLASAHRTWFHSGVDLTYVPNAKLARQALKMELPADRIRTIGLPTRPQFWDPWIPTKLSARNTMGLSPSAHNILVVGGGEGLGPISDVAWELAKEIEKRNKTTEKKNDVLLGGKQNVALPPIELVIICGKNKGVKESLQRMKWPPDVYVTVYGFTSKLDVLMAAADVMVTKAGPGTIAEACIKGLPLIISSYIPGQEYGNVEFSVSRGFAVYCTKPKEISVTVMDLLKDPVRLQAMSKAARASAQPNAALSIAEDIVKTVLPSVYNQHT